MANDNIQHMAMDLGLSGKALKKRMGKGNKDRHNAPRQVHKPEATETLTAPAAPVLQAAE